MVTSCEKTENPSNRLLRIGFVLHGMDVAGAEVLVSEIVASLRHEIDPTIICLDHIGELGEKRISEGYHIECLHRRPGKDFRVAIRLARIVRTRKIELLHAHQYTPYFYSALAKIWLRGKVGLLLTEHGRAFPDRVSKTRRFVNHLVLGRLADSITGVSDFSNRALNQIDGFPAHRVHLIPNGVRPELYQKPSNLTVLRRSLGFNPNRRIVICIARLHPVKDHISLLEAFALVARSIHDVDLVLVGDGPLRKALQATANQLDIGSRVYFTGIRADIPDLLAASDIFALTSLSEAASITLLEAMATSLPVLVTNVGGNPEFVRHGVEGLLVPRSDVSAMASALTRLLNDSDLCHSLGSAGRLRVETQFCLEKVLNMYEVLYQQILLATKNPGHLNRVVAS